MFLNIHVQYHDSSRTHYFWEKYWLADTAAQLTVPSKITSRRLLWKLSAFMPFNGVSDQYRVSLVIVRPLSKVEYTSITSVFHCRRGLTNLIHDRRGCTLFTLVCGH